MLHISRCFQLPKRLIIYPPPKIRNLCFIFLTNGTAICPPIGLSVFTSFVVDQKRIDIY